MSVDGENIRLFGKAYMEEILPIPYSGPIGCVLFTGTLYVRDPVQDTYTDGAMTGCVNGTYHVDHNEAEFWDKEKGVKAGVKIDFDAKKFFCQACVFDNLSGKWKCSGWKEFAAW